ncbi:MAG: family 78 glycoside hydrolase catalytic domain [Victivallales bacterium]|nr:family 78 glycoside hydrolase catalytic domain [Victivallales bacterium]
MNKQSILLAVAVLSATALFADLKVEKLRCEYLANPMAVHEAVPRLSWTLSSNNLGAKQTAYRILVASTAEKLAANQGDIWDSGKVISDENVLIPYAGPALTSKQDCHWKVQVWDREQDTPSSWSAPAHWRMGLLKPEDWNDAQWIVLPNTASEFKTDHNGFHSAFVPTADTVQWVQIDLQKPTSIDSIRLYPTCPYDYVPKTPGFLFPVRYRIETANKEDFSDAVMLVDMQKEDAPNPKTNPAIHTFPPKTGRYVRLTVTHVNRSRDGFGYTLAEMEVFSGKNNIALNKPVTASGIITSGGWGYARLVDGRLVSERGNGGAPRPAIRFRKEFKLTKKPTRALVAATGLGTYELFINGQRVGDAYMAPEWTAYPKRIFYQVYDVTSLLEEGDNTVAAEVASGWWDSPMFAGRRVPGCEYCFKACLDIDNATKIVTDATWLANDQGPVRRAEIYYGIDYDGTREQPFWNDVGFDASKWSSAIVIPAPKGSENALLLGQTNEPITCEQILKPKALTNPKPGIWVFDMAQNMVGLCELTADAPRGTAIRVAFGEMLNPDGTVYRANLRGAQELWTIVWPGGKRTLSPRHTYYGYRYVEITGLTTPPTIDDFRGNVMFSSAPSVSAIMSSNKLMQRILHCILWNHRGNMFSTATDCPQRDERMGWTADMFSFSQTAIFNRDMAAFITKYEQDIIDEQKPNGQFPDIAPGVNHQTNFFGAPGWADTGVHLPWRLYQNYADKRILERSYPAAKRWVDFVHKQCTDGLIWTKHREHDYGEWLNGDTLVLNGYPRGHCEMPKEQFATAIFAYTVHILAETAKVLEYKEDADYYDDLFGQIRKAFQTKYMNEDGTFKHETQASYALALDFGIAYDSQRDKIFERLLACIKDYKDHLSTGFHATHRMMLQLSDNGHHDIANDFLNLRTVPSWGYMIDNGATTLWERWDGYVAGRGFQNPGMNSFNHWAFGSVGEWIWRTLVGLNPDDNAPGFKHVVIRPRPDARTAQIRAAYDSIRGKFDFFSNYNAADKRYTLFVAIPPSATATAYVPCTDAASLREGNKPIAENPHIRVIRIEKDAVVLELESGRYSFISAFDK